LIILTAYLLMFAILLLLGGPRLVKKFLRGKFLGATTYVVLAIDGKTVAYKNPRGHVGHEDQPLLLFPYELFHSGQFWEYYNACWFEYGGLFRCGHKTHLAPEDVQGCAVAKKIDGYVIGKVLEEQ